MVKLLIHKCLVDAYEMKAQMSKHPVTLQIVGHVRNEITNMIDQVMMFVSMS
jgi:hypothetical protein